MCGIYGIVNGSKFRKAEPDIVSYMKDAVVANSLRGMDSTGMFQMKRNGKVVWHKDAVSGTEFLKDSTALDLFRDTDDCRLTVVHNRAATRGAITARNCHPFQHINDDGDYVIGVHNGTLSPGWEREKNGLDTEVDSDWAIAQITHEGVDKAFQKIVGPSAFVWYSPREGEVLNLFRNAGRPMFVTFVKNEDRMLFASEYQMVEWLATRNTLQIESSIIELAPVHLYQFSLDSPRSFEKRKLDTFPPVKAYVSPETRLFTELERIFADTSKALDAVNNKPAGESTPLPDPVVKANNKGRAIIVVTAEEQRLARAGEVMGKEVIFYEETHDAERNELWGVATGEGEMWAAVVRRIDTARYQQLKKHPYLTGSVIGATTIDALKGSKTKELTVILSHRSLGVPKNPPITETIAESDDNAQLALALKEAIEQHNQAKVTNEQPTFH